MNKIKAFLKKIFSDEPYVATLVLYHNSQKEMLIFKVTEKQYKLIMEKKLPDGCTFISAYRYDEVDPISHPLTTNGEYYED